MRPTLYTFPLALAVLTHCKRHEPPPPPPAPPPEVPTAQAPVMPSVEAAAALPLTASLRLGAFVHDVGDAGAAALSEDARAAIGNFEHEFHLPEGSLLDGTWPAALGIDASRAITLRLLPMDPRVRAAIDRFAAASGTAAALEPMLTRWEPPFLAVQLAIPSTNLTSLQTTARALAQQSCTEDTALPGYDSVWRPRSADRPLLVGFSHDDASLYVSLLVAPNKTVSGHSEPDFPAGRQLLGTLRTRYAGALTAPLAARPGALAIDWDFPALADMNIAMGLENARQVLENVDGNPAFPAINGQGNPGGSNPREDLTATAVREALRARELIRRDGAPFERGAITVDVDAGTVRFRAQGGAEMPLLPAMPLGASTLEAPTAIASGDVSAAFLNAWHLPGDPTANGGGTELTQFETMLNEAGGLSVVLALPHGPALVARTVLAEATRSTPVYLRTLAPFERIGVEVLSVNPDRLSVAGLLLPEAAANAPGCVFTPAGHPCTTRLTPGAPTALPDGAGHGKLLELNGRVLVAASDEVDDLARTTLRAVPSRQAPALRGTIDLARFFAEVQRGGIPSEYVRWEVEARAEGRDVELVLHRAPLPRPGPR